MEALLAIFASTLAFLVPLAIPLFATRWRSFLIVLGVGVAFFAWLTIDLAGVPTGGGHWIGAFIGGLMLFGFAAGAIAKAVMLIGRRTD